MFFVVRNAKDEFKTRLQMKYIHLSESGANINQEITNTEMMM